MFSATYIGQAAVAAISAVILVGVKLPMPSAAERVGGRPLGIIVRQPRFILAIICGVFFYVLMNFLMTAAPLAMTARLPASRVHLSTAVRQITMNEQGCAIECVRPDGTTKSLKAAQVVLALRPRLLAQAIAFEPELGGVTLPAWARTPTWMAPHAKFVAVYDRPF